MFNLGDTVVYAASGVCKITDIKKEHLKNLTKEYYVLEPLFSKNSKIFVPLDNDVLLSRIVNTLNKNEVSSLLSELSDFVPTWDYDDTKRAENFKQTLISNNRKALLQMIKSIIVHSNEIYEKKRHLHNADELVLKRARDAVCTEFAYVLNKDVDEIFTIIKKSVHNELTPKE